MVLGCNRNEECRSFNFCYNGVCELNREDVFSTQEGDIILKDDVNCIYYGLKKDSSPICSNEEGFVSIRQNVRRANLIGGCRISNKRVDREWGPWELAETIDDGEEWKITMGREIVVDAAHNGKEGADYDENVTSWLKFLKRAMAWEDAKAACVQEGGRLFYDINGTAEHLEFLRNKMDQNAHWLVSQHICEACGQTIPSTKDTPDPTSRS